MWSVAWQQWLGRCPFKSWSVHRYADAFLLILETESFNEKQILLPAPEAQRGFRRHISVTRFCDNGTSSYFTLIFVFLIEFLTNSSKQYIKMCLLIVDEPSSLNELSYFICYVAGKQKPVSRLHLVGESHERQRIATEGCRDIKTEEHERPGHPAEGNKAGKLWEYSTVSRACLLFITWKFGNMHQQEQVESSPCHFYCVLEFFIAILWKNCCLYFPFICMFKYWSQVNLARSSL